MVKHKFTAKIFLYDVFGFLFRFPLSLYLLRKVSIRELGGVNSIAVHITGKCNLDCVYCNQHNPQGKDASFQEFFKVVDESGINGIKEVMLAGGEPFVHPDIFRMLDYCQSKGLKPSVYTNGAPIIKADMYELKLIKGLALSSVLSLAGKCRRIVL